MKKFFILFFAFALLAGCSAGELPPQKFTPVTSNKIYLNVAKISIVDHSAFQPSNSPYNSYPLSPTISQAVRSWIQDTLRAGGTTGQATIYIQDASLSSRALATSDDMMDRWFKRQQASRYTGHINVQLDISAGKSYALTNAEADQFITLPEEPTPTERQNAYVQLLEGLTREFRKNFGASLEDHAHWALMAPPAQ